MKENISKARIYLEEAALQGHEGAQEALNDLPAAESSAKPHSPLVCSSAAGFLPPPKAGSPVADSAKENATFEKTGSNFSIF